MYVQLRQAKQLSINGHPTSFQPGDWVEVGRQTAEMWAARGECYISATERRKAAPLPDEAGVLVTQAEVSAVIGKFEDYPYLKLEMGEPALLWRKTVLWDGLSPLRLELIPLGLSLLDTWEAVIPLVSYTHLARDEGDEEERARTQAMVRDLRVLLYDPRLVFLRDCESTRRLLATWKQEGDGRLALLRAIYRVKPLILALPVTWMA